MVMLKEPTARLVIKDLIKYDSEVQINKELNVVIDKNNQEINLLNQKEGMYKEKVNNLNEIITKKDEIFKLEQDKNKEITENYKKQKRRTTLFQITTFVVTALAGALLISK